MYPIKALYAHILINKQMQTNDNPSEIYRVCTNHVLKINRCGWTICNLEIVPPVECLTHREDKSKLEMSHWEY